MAVDLAWDHLSREQRRLLVTLAAKGELGPVDLNPPSARIALIYLSLLELVQGAGGGGWELTNRGRQIVWGRT